MAQITERRRLIDINEVCEMAGAKRRSIVRWYKSRKSFEAITYSPDGARLALACGDKRIRIWDTTTGQELKILEGPTDAIGSVVAVIFSPDGRRLACGDWAEQVVRVWDVRPAGRSVRP
jgi:WD40 repeat protein